MEQTSDPVAEFAKLPLPDRVAHKNWKVREAAYRELTDKLKFAEEDARIYSDFFPTLGKIVRDANAPAQLAGFDAVAKYADTAPAPLVRRAAADLTKGIVDKGLSGRPANKAKAVEAFLMLVGADCGDIVADVMASHAFKHRTPKVVAAAVDALTTAIDTYGAGAVAVKPIATKLPPLFGHSQEMVRNAAKALAIELHRWVGDSIKVVVKSAKEVTIKEVEAAFAKHAGKGKPQPKKLTRSMEQRVRERGAGGDDVDSDDGFGDGGPEEEELDLAEEINLLEKLAKVKIEVEEGVMKDWYTAVDSKKWSARKQALDTAVNVIGEARLTPASHQEVFSRLRKILAKDSNVNVVASAAKLVRAMCGGLKKQFPHGAAKALTVDLFGRLKEKNRVVVDTVSGALDALHSKKCIRVFEMLEEISTAAKHKVPKARCELLSWLGRCVREGTSGADLKGPPLKCFGLLFLKATDDSAPEVRDAGLGGLASLEKVVGERNVAIYLEKLDKKRKDKVAAIVAELPEPRKVAASKPKPSSSPKPKPVAKPKAKTKTSTAGRAPAKGKKGASPAKRPKAAKPVRPVIEESDDEGEISHSPEDALDLAAERFEGFEKDQWRAKSFKARVAIVGLVNDGLRETGVFSKQDVSLALGLLSCAPGLADSNFMALKPKLELFGMVASRCSNPPPRKSLRPLLRNSVEKLGDIKSAKMAGEIMMSFAEATSPRYFFEILAEAILETNNGRAVIAMLKFAGKIVEDFGMSSVPEKSLTKVAVANIGNATPAARTAALALACKAASRLKEGQFRKLMENCDASEEVLELFDGEIQKYGREPDPPTRKKRFGPLAASAVSNQVSETPTDANDSEQEPAPVVRAQGGETLLAKGVDRFANAEEPPVIEAQVDRPRVRVSIAEHFMPGARIFLELKNSNWKKRQDALAAINKVMEDAHDFIKPDLGTEIMIAIRARLSDSNRNLATAAYEVVGRLIRALGPDGAVALKLLAPAVMGHGCVDIKKTVREAATKVLWSWFDVLGLSPLVPFCNLPLASLNSGFRKEFLEWLVPRLQGGVGSFDASAEDLHPLVDPILVCLRDRTAEVRHLADQVLEQVIRSVGIGALDAKLANMTKSARHQIEPILEKHRSGPQANSGSEVQGGKFSSVSTPRAGRDRPRSMAVPRTPGARRGVFSGDDPGTPAGAGARRPRPASARVSPMVASGAGFGAAAARLDTNLLLQNDGRDVRARRFMNNRRQFMEELTQVDPSGEIQPMISEDIEDIAADLAECCAPALCLKLTAPANRFRMHVEAIELVSAHLESSPETLMFGADVLLRWAACRIEDSRTPPTVLVKLASFVSNICEILMSSGAKIGEYETSAILPPVVEKCGSNRETIRQAMRTALLALGDVVEDEVMLILLSSCLRYTLTPFAYDEVSVEICRLLDKRCGSGAGMPPGVLSTIGRVAGGEDDSAGRAAAVCLERAHEFFGDDLWNLVGDLSNDQAALLDDRLKGVSGRSMDAASPLRREAHEVLGAVAQEDAVDDSSVVTATEPGLPSDIRNEDFRLSVAPAPPSSVITSISESLNTATPVKTRMETQPDTIPSTPSLPVQSHGGVGSNEDEELASDILLRLQSEDRDLQLSGLASLFDDLKNESVLLRSAGGAQLLLQLVRCFVNTLARLEGNSAVEDDPAVLKSFLKGVIRFAREPQLLRRLDQSAVERLLGDALRAMIPQTVEGVEDWDQVRRGVNLMIVKVLESCDQNLLYTAMINLLLQNLKAIQNPGSDEVSSALARSSICIKSIAKVTKRGFADCRVNALLRDIHLFLMANPVRREGSAASTEDQTFAMRLLKTVVNSIIDEIGSDICLHLDLIPQPDKSQLVQYIDMTLIDLRRANGDSADAAAVALGRRREAESSVESCLQKIERQQDKDSSLRQLRSVLGWCPEVDLGPHLEKYSERTRVFVAEGLRKPRRPSLGETVEDETEVRKLESQVSFLGATQIRRADPVPLRQAQVSAADDSGTGMPASGTVHSAGQVYLKRLHEIQLRYGLQTGSRSLNEGAGTRAVEKENGAMQKVSVDDARDKASSLRERMARIRELQGLSKE